MNRAVLWVGAYVALVLAASPDLADAQVWRTISGSRQVRGESRLDVEIEFASGTLRLHPGVRETLFRVEARYDEQTFESSTSYDPRDAHLAVKVTPGDHGRNLDLDDDSPQYLDLALSPAVPLSLDFKFGVARSEIELGGLAVHRAVVKTGASSGRIGFDTPNRITCEEFEVAVGAAELTVYGLGHARCEQVKVAGGAGDVTLDFTGSWLAGALTEADITMGFGSLTLRIPEDVGVELTMNRLFASVEKQGFVKHGSRWVSENFDDATATLELRLRAFLGDIAVDWVSAR